MKASQKKESMSVREMREILGIKKTGSKDNSSRLSLLMERFASTSRVLKTGMPIRSIIIKSTVRNLAEN